jgi:hypothetical protein
MKGSISFKELNERLIKHYKLFNEESFWLDDYDESNGICIIVCPTYFETTGKQCKQIAKFVKKNIPHHMFSYIYVGPFFFKTTEL